MCSRRCRTRSGSSPTTSSSTPAQRAYVARLDGEVVAAAQSVAADGVLGVFGVAVVPDARRRGIGSAIAAHVIADRGAGTTPAVLESSAMGEGVYERLGFRTLMTREAWVRPEPSR
jgi:predicted GNAT family acetyltransferase